MPLAMDMIGKESAPIPYEYDEKSVILYALGIGAGVEELGYVYEKNLKVYPTFAVIPMYPAVMALMSNAGLNFHYVLHLEQEVILRAAIPTRGTLHTTAVWTSVYDKGDKGAILTIGARTKDSEGKMIAETRMAIVDRSAGNFGGDKGPKTERLQPPEGIEPDFRIEHRTSPNQAAIYRLTGDMNPLHIDPEFAGKGGLPKPILHGLCSYGFAGRAVLDAVCQSDPQQFKSFSASFAGMVFPGDKLITECWKIGAGLCSVQTKTDDGRLVLANGRAEIA